MHVLMSVRYEKCKFYTRLCIFEKIISISQIRVLQSTRIRTLQLYIFNNKFLCHKTARVLNKCTCPLSGADSQKFSACIQCVLDETQKRSLSPSCDSLINFAFITIPSRRFMQKSEIVLRIYLQIKYIFRGIRGNACSFINCREYTTIIK